MSADLARSPRHDGIVMVGQRPSALVTVIVRRCPACDVVNNNLVWLFWRNDDDDDGFCKLS